METAIVETWKRKLEEALHEMLVAMQQERSDEAPEFKTPADHFTKTPERVRRHFEESLFGPPLTEEVVKAVLSAEFTGGADEMVLTGGVEFTTYCAHHLVPVLCVGYFAYIPNGKIVGLSKVARLMELLGRRPSVQEELTQQMVGLFEKYVAPKGCAFLVRGTHMCMVARGVKKPGSWTQTTALRGCFMRPEVRQEFLSAVPVVRER